jgi:hypothetical protein
MGLLLDGKSADSVRKPRDIAFGREREPEGGFWPPGHAARTVGRHSVSVMGRVCVYCRFIGQGGQWKGQKGRGRLASS